MAHSMGFKKVWVQVDSIIVVGMLRSQGSWNLVHKPLIMKCTDIIARDDWEVKVSHCYSKINRVLDRLPNLGIEKDLGVVYFQSRPKEVINAMNADVVGVEWPRNTT